MQFTKGTSGNPTGKTKNPQPAEKQLRKQITDFMMLNFKHVVADFDKLPVRDKVRIFCELYRHTLPKAKEEDLNGILSRIPEDQLDEIVQRLRLSNLKKENHEPETEN